MAWRSSPSAARDTGAGSAAGGLRGAGTRASLLIVVTVIDCSPRSVLPATPVLRRSQPGNPRRLPRPSFPGCHSPTRTRSHTPGPARIRRTYSRGGASGSLRRTRHHAPAAHPVTAHRHRRRERPRRLLDPAFPHVGDEEPRPLPHGPALELHRLAVLPADLDRSRATGPEHPAEGTHQHLSSTSGTPVPAHPVAGRFPRPIHRARDRTHVRSLPVELLGRPTSSRAARPLV